MNPAAVLIVAPTAAVLTRDQVKAHLRVDHSDDDTTIDEIIAAAVDTIDPAAGGWLGRALRPQTWELRLHDFPCGAIVLPYPPLISLSSFTFDDSGGVARTLVMGTDFNQTVDTRGRVSLVPPRGGRWPSSRCYPDSVRVRYEAGYPAEDLQADPPVKDRMPWPIKAWLKLVIGSLYENRDSLAAGAREQVAELPPHIVQMISQCRIL